MDKKNRLRLVYQELRNRGLVHTQKGFAEALGKAEGTMSRAFAGDEKALTDNLFMQITKTFPDMFTQSWLLTGEGDMLLKHQEPRVIDQGSLTNAALAAYNAAIEQANARVAMLQQQLADERDAHALELQRINAAHRQEIDDKQEIIRLLRQQASSNIITYPTGVTDGQLKKKHIPTL